MYNPRKHHYVPQFYLSCFAAERGSPRLYVLDKETRKSYPSNIRNAGCERDFYIVEVEDEGDPFTVERFLSTIEDTGADAIRFIIEHRELPEVELRQKLMAFLAVMSVRSPAAIEAFERPVSQILKSVLWHVTRSKEAFDRFIAEGSPEAKQVDAYAFEEARLLVDNDEYEVSMGQNFRMSWLLKMLKSAEPLLAARNWSVVAASDDAPDFICSDRPFTICWTTPMPGPYGPALGARNTTAMFPLSRRLALLGLFENVAIPVYLSATAVGIVNMHTARHAKRFIYSGSDNFTVTLADGSSANREEFVAGLL